MNDFQTLADAFAELERQADAVTAGRAAQPVRMPTARRHPSRPLLLAGSVAAVSTVAVGATLLTHGHGSPGAPVAAGSRTSTVSPSPTAMAPFRIPRTPEELARRFTRVLAGTATFTVTGRGTLTTVPVPPAPSGSMPPGLSLSVPPPPKRSTGPTTTRSMAPTTSPSTRPTTSPPSSIAPTRRPLTTPTTSARPTANGAYIVGTLTAGRSTGGFDLQIFRATPGSKPLCEDADRAHCTARRLADGSWLLVGREQLENTATGITYQVDYVRSDGVEFLMHVSNERDPKGASDVLAPRPPLTTRQMTAIVTSGRW